MLKNNTAAKDAEYLINLLPILYQELGKRENNFLTQGKISCPQLLALQKISNAGPLRMKDLSQGLNIRMATATGLVDRLVKAGWVERKLDSNDRRAVVIQLLPQGKKIISDIYLQKKKIITRVFEKLSSHETTAYVKQFEKIVHLLSKESL